MSSRHQSTRAQTLFLRAFLTSPDGPPPADWPSPAIFRRWLRHPGFRAALQSIRDAARVQADLRLASAGNAAATTLQSLTTATPSADSSRHFDNLLHLMRLAHIRQRFTSDPPLPTHHPDYAELMDYLKQCHPDGRLVGVLANWTDACKARYPNHHDSR